MVALLPAQTDGKQQSLATITDAAKHLGIPVSSLTYHIILGHVGRQKLGPYWFVDVIEAREALRKYGYKRREKVVG